MKTVKINSQKLATDETVYVDTIIDVYKVHQLWDANKPINENNNWCAYANLENAIIHLDTILNDSDGISGPDSIKVGEFYFTGYDDGAYDYCYVIEKAKMTKEKFDNLTEFEGF